MEKFRLKAVKDRQTNLFSAEIYYPKHSYTPIARTATIYSSKEDAIEAAKTLITEYFKEDLLDKE